MACLDTCVLLDIWGRGAPAVKHRAESCVRRLILSGEALATTRFNEAELWVGIERSHDPQREQTAVEHMLVDLDILDFDSDAARIFGRITAYLQKHGQPVGDMDILIAAVAMANKHTLVTRNTKHYLGIPGLTIESY